MNTLKKLALLALCAGSLQVAYAKEASDGTRFINISTSQYNSLVKDITQNPKAESTTQDQVQTVNMAGQKGELSYLITQEGHPAHPSLIMLSLYNGAGKTDKEIVVFSSDAGKEAAAKAWASQY